MKKTFGKITVLLLAALCAFSSFGFTFIKWVDCSVSRAVLSGVYDLCVKYHGTENAFDFSRGVAYIATRNGNKFSSKDRKYLKELEQNVKSGNLAGKYGDNKYFRYHEEAYGAIFGNFVGEYKTDGEEETKFGMTAYFPLASGYSYSHYDDFGSSRSFGFKRRHLGHDIMGAVGTPVVAVEGGKVTELGWNRYGGWRVGITSLDGKRYYYYAHLRKGKPFARDLVKGASVGAGQVIGYLGATGYSDKEDVNLRNCAPHLHFGMQLIFDPSQKDGNGEIWIDVWALTKFLERNKAKTVKGDDGEAVSVGLRTPVSLPQKLPM